MGTLALLSASGGPGCKRLEEKQALRRYAARESRLDEARRALAALDPELAEKVEADDVSALRSFLKERYLPRFRKMVSVLRKLPARTARLRRIRRAYLAAAERALEAHEGFADRLGTTPRPEAWAKLQRHRRRCQEARAGYRERLDAYYREHDLRRSKR